MRKKPSSKEADTKLAAFKSLFRELKDQVDRLGVAVRRKHRTQAGLEKLHDAAQKIGKTSAQFKKMVRLTRKRKK
jgi:hypothetical protein